MLVPAVAVGAVGVPTAPTAAAATNTTQVATTAYVRAEVAALVNSAGAIISGGVKIGYGSLIGAGAVIIQGVKIGDNCVVGAGAVVRHSVNDSVTVVGNPATQLE